MGADAPGSLEQQQVVRDVLKVEYGSRQHRWLKRLDQDVNASSRHYITIDFVSIPYLGLAFANGILLSELLVKDGIEWVLPHEVGHVHDQRFLTQDDKNWFMERLRSPEQLPPFDTDWRHHQEMFADAFRDWWLGTGWDSLTPLLLAS